TFHLTNETLLVIGAPSATLATATGRALVHHALSPARGRRAFPQRKRPRSTDARRDRRSPVPEPGYAPTLAVHLRALPAAPRTQGRAGGYGCVPFSVSRSQQRTQGNPVMPRAKSTPAAPVPRLHTTPALP